MNKRTHQILSIFLLTIVLGSCKKDNSGNSIPVYTVPATYNFVNFNDSAQLKLLAMADQIGAKINLANTTPNTVVSAQQLKDMFNNVNGYFVDSSLKLNASGLRLADYCSPAAKTDVLTYFDSVGIFSQSTVTASAGIAGVAASSASPTKKYLLSPTGIFYSQVFKKLVMGGICAYEIASVYLTDSIGNSVDNKTVVAGSGTAMEHHWDEAFGLFGVPVTFPATTTGSRYLGSYSNQVDAGLGCNAAIMNAFLKGRAAISAGDMNTKQQQATILISMLDQLDAAAIVQEMKETDANIEAGDAVAAYGTLSESLGFVRNLKYYTSPARKITDAQIAQLLALYDSANPSNPNLYAFVNASVLTKAQIEAKTDAIRQFIGKVYGFTATQLAAQ
ncbi:MAG TPA: DUF4856 domain-containing protein [Puia sp.]|jgi:hypothetical protein